MNQLLRALSQTWTTHVRRSRSNLTIWTPFYQTFDLITVGVVALVRLGTALANRNGGQLSCGTKFWYTGHMVTLFVGTQVGVGTTLSSRDRGQVTIGTILEGTVHLSTLDNVVKTVEGIWTTLTHRYRSYRTISGSKCRISGLLWTFVLIRTASISWSQASILAEFILTIDVGTDTIPSPGFCDCSFNYTEIPYKQYNIEDIHLKLFSLPCG